MSYCVSCGSPVPDGQNNCSMCYGDPYYGRDGYYLEWLEQQDEQANVEAENWEELQSIPDDEIPF